MTRGEKLVSFKIEGNAYTYLQPGWWCSLTDPEDIEGQLVDEDNQIAEMARRTAKAMAGGKGVRARGYPRHPPALRADPARGRLAVRHGRKILREV